MHAPSVYQLRHLWQKCCCFFGSFIEAMANELDVDMFCNLTLIRRMKIFIWVDDWPGQPGQDNAELNAFRKRLILLPGISPWKTSDNLGSRYRNFQPHCGGLSMVSLSSGNM
ncbi:hypothetical protein VNO77_35266 [Canavalia gladiata]|uniref:Uncharacterized protein n=1 Tax=Canavalia gladiata TaxID=3824 RepID=A0AAN9KF53_CANGL